MNNSCPNPGCDAIYHVTAQHVGRRITCKKCGTSLIVAVEGLQLADGVPAPPVAEPQAAFATDAEEAPIPRRVRRPGSGFDLGRVLSGFADIPTWLYGAGAILVILFTFLPLIDAVKVARRQAAIEEGDLRQARADAELRKKDKPSADDEEKRKKAREEWDKQKTELERDVDAAKIAQKRLPYWYLHLIMLGFVLLAAGSIGFMTPKQSTIRRVLGCITLVAIVLVIFTSLAGVGISFNVGAGGRPLLDVRPP